MSGFLLDTHVWLWHLGGNKELPRGLSRSIDESRADCWLSPISVWEVGTLARRRRIRLSAPFLDWTREALRKLPLQEAEITVEVALATDEVDANVTDPADRFLAATAVVYDLTLLTVDGRLTRAKGIPTRSR
ncbi:MAG TPA: type II toxin-antitoxin system VapC family toxin [Actinomycetota bacterium]